MFIFVNIRRRERARKKKKQDNIHEVKPPQLFPFNFHFQQPYHNLNRTPKAWLAFTFLPAVFRRIYFYSGKMLNFNHLMIWKIHQKTIFQGSYQKFYFDDTFIDCTVLLPQRTFVWVVFPFPQLICTYLNQISIASIRDVSQIVLKTPT